MIKLECIEEEIFDGPHNQVLAKELKVEEWVQKTIEQDLCVLKTQRQTDHKGVVFGEERKHIRERERERERERGGGVWSLKKKIWLQVLKWKLSFLGGVGIRRH